MRDHNPLVFDTSGIDIRAQIKRGKREMRDLHQRQAQKAETLHRKHVRKQTVLVQPDGKELDAPRDAPPLQDGADADDELDCGGGVGPEPSVRVRDWQQHFSTEDLRRRYREDEDST